MASEIFAVVEHRDGVLRRVSLEALAVASQIARARGSDVSLVAAGASLDPVLVALAGAPAARIIALEHPSLTGAPPTAAAGLIARLARERAPEAIVVSATSQGRDLAARLSARLDTGLLPDAMAFTVGPDGTLEVVRPVYAGKIQATVSTRSRPQVLTIRPKVFDPVSLSTGASGPPVERPCLEPEPRDLRTRITAFHQIQSTRPDLVEADIIVSGGRGMKGPENFRILEELADVLHAAVGASRAAVDAGWREHSAQVGQTGRTVTPKLYIACGISGAIQHLVGMSNSKYVLAINKDREAPIYKRADFGIPEDLFKVVPALTAELRKVQGG